MALTADYLVDKSATARLHIREIDSRLSLLAEQGQLVTCSVIDLEIGFSARSGHHHRTIMDNRQRMSHVATSQSTLDLSLALQRRLADIGHHRVSIPDLIISACAIENDLVVVHYDRDFDTIGRVSELQSEWVVPAGSVP
jgi:predicted nucleic acid-binding protein